ncbi:hypothetical protein FYZ48_15015 [Gimesia chilikensis]|uniref:hypothetical protein n=1 Tax=Gimesia chilikensis TaxID=2605989 RepID=UPI0011EED92E|nr:hypothetical protein [Gimesia chilikensis]KAA0137977.1 hypothetical protein FYZ48_15015 [Gimesia chilikensis]
MCQPASQYSTRFNIQWTSINGFLLSKKTPAAGNHREYEYRNRWQTPFHPQIRVSPNAIRAERSEQETDRAEHKPQQNPIPVKRSSSTHVSAWRPATNINVPRKSQPATCLKRKKMLTADTRTSVSLSPRSNSFDPNESKTAQEIIPIGVNAHRGSITSAHQPPVKRRRGAAKHPNQNQPAPQRGV